MLNPWLDVPLAEYEQHMRSAEVRQSKVLSDLFAEAIGRCNPSSVAVLGVAGGNGLERIDWGVTKRVVGVDLNPQYLEAVRHRYSDLPGLELHCVDLAQQRLELEPVRLVHAALIFEHAGADYCLENAIAMVAPGGHLSVVLQMPSESGQKAVASRFSSIESLGPHFSMINSEWLCKLLAGRGFALTHQTTCPLPAGKSFWAGIFSAPETR